jgi:arylsulfatase A-like enzyme
MKKLLDSLTVIFLVTATTMSCVSQPSTKPNLLIIQTDEHNFRTLGCYREQLSSDQALVWGEGNIVETPNIDLLADNGVIFTKFYAASPVCTPSRGSFISGLYPQNNGSPKNDLPLNDDVWTYSMVLRDDGYKTAFVGKWHLDGTGKPQWAPKRKFGFEDNRFMFNRGHWKKMEDTSNGPRISATDQNGAPSYNLDNADEKSFVTDFLVDRGIDFIRKNKEQPFSLYISLTDPHGPDRVRSPYDTMYTHMDFKAPFTYNKSIDGVPSWAKQAKNAGINQAQYFGMVKCIDDNVGKIVSFLQTNHLIDNTIIVFTSDHGDLRGEHHKHNKGNPLEASAKIPFIVYYPRMIPSASVVTKAFNTVDFAPTILSLMNQDIPATMTGRDFSELLVNPNDQGNWSDITFMRNGGEADNGQWVAAVTSRYKLILSKKDEPWLVDLETDPNELINFIKEPGYENIVKNLARQLEEYGRVHSDPFLVGTKMATDLEILR